MISISRSHTSSELHSRVLKLSRLALYTRVLYLFLYTRYICHGSLPCWRCREDGGSMRCGAWYKRSRTIFLERIRIAPSALPCKKKKKKLFVRSFWGGTATPDTSSEKPPNVEVLYHASVFVPGPRCVRYIIHNRYTIYYIYTHTLW